MHFEDHINLIYIYTSNSYTGDVLASSNNQTSIRNKRVAPLIVGLGAVILAGGVAVVVQNSIVNEMDERFKPRPPQPSVSESLEAVNRLVYGFYEEFNDKNGLCHREPNRRRRQPSPNNCPIPVLTTPGKTIIMK